MFESARPDRLVVVNRVRTMMTFLAGKVTR